MFQSFNNTTFPGQGLRLLYEFKEQHSDASIEPFLLKSTQFFRDYIQRGLQSIELDRRRQAASPAPASVPKSTGVNVPINKTPVLLDNACSMGDGSSEDAPNPQYYAQRLRALQQCAGFDEVSNAVSAPLKSDQNLDLEAQLGFDQNLNFNSLRENTNEVS